MAPVTHRTGMFADGWSTVAFEGLGVLVAVGALWVTAGPVGAAIGAAVAVTWLLASTVHAVAVGQTCVVVLLADAAALDRLLADPTAATDLLAVQAGLTAPLAGSLLGRWSPAIAVGATLAFLVAAGTLATAVFVESLSSAAALLVGAYVVTAYGLYRYELVRVGHVEVES